MASSDRDLTETEPGQTENKTVGDDSGYLPDVNVIEPVMSAEKPTLENITPTEVNETEPVESVERTVENIDDLSPEKMETGDVEDVKESEVPDNEMIETKIVSYQEYIAQEELLWTSIEAHGDEVLLFTKDKDCALSLELLALFEENIENSIMVEVVHVNDVSGETIDLNDILWNLTGNDLPVVFYKKQYIGNHKDVVNACRFNRLDLLLESPLCPCYHLVIIGTGPGTQAALTEIERLGESLNVAIIEPLSPVPYEADRVLGLGPQGNLPRYLLWDAIREAQAKIESGQLIADWDFLSGGPSLLWDKCTTNIQQDIACANWTFRKQIASGNVDFYCGNVEFLGSDIISVTSNVDYSDSSSFIEDSETHTINIVAMNYIISGGSRARVPKFPGFEYCLPIDNFLYESELPSRSIIIGNTPQVFELAYLIACYSGTVTVMNKSSHWLHKYDKDSVAKVIESFKDLRVKFLNVSRIDGIEEFEEGYKVRVKLLNGRHYCRTCVTVIIDYPRIPVSEYLNLEEAGVKLDPLLRKIIVDQEFKSTNPTLWAFGTTVRGHMGTPHFETLAGKRVINLILKGVDNFPLPRLFPRVLITPLEYGFVGETEKTAKLKFKTEINVYESKHHTIALTGARVQEPAFHIKIICKIIHCHCIHQEKLEIVVGVHFLGKGASHLITGFGPSVEKGITKREFMESLSAIASTELGLYSTELVLKSGSEKVKSSKSDTTLINTSIQCLRSHCPYRSFEQAPLSWSYIHDRRKSNKSSELTIPGPDAEQQINVLPDFDLWGLESTITCTADVNYTEITSLRESSSLSILEFGSLQQKLSSSDLSPEKVYCGSLTSGSISENSLSSLTSLPTIFSANSFPGALEEDGQYEPHTNSPVNLLEEETSIEEAVMTLLMLLTHLILLPRIENTTPSVRPKTRRRIIVFSDDSDDEHCNQEPVATNHPEIEEYSLTSILGGLGDDSFEEPTVEGEEPTVEGEEPSGSGGHNQ